MIHPAKALAFVAAFAFARAANAQTRTGAAVELRIGSVRAPFFAEALPEVVSDYQAYAIVLGAHHEIETWRMSARLPLATSSIEQPAGSYVAEYTLGNPELGLEHELSQQRTADVDGVFPTTRVRVALGLPLAGSGPATTLVRNRVVAASNAVLGWRQPELYTPGVIPITPALSLGVERPPWRVELDLKVPLLLRLHDAELPETTRTRPAGALAVLGVDGWLRPLRWVAVGARADVVATLVPLVDPARDVGRSGRLQLSGGPCLSFMLAQGLVLQLDVALALGGPLAGTGGLGMQLELGW